MAKAGANYMNSQLIKMEAIANGYVEGIALDENGFVSEGSGENLFLVHRDKLITAPLGNSVLPGITRDSVLQIARDLNIPIVEQMIPREMLYIADEVVLHRHGGRGHADPLGRQDQGRQRHDGPDHQDAAERVLRHRARREERPPRLADAGPGAQQAAGRRIIRVVNSSQGRGFPNDSRPLRLLQPEKNANRALPSRRRTTMSQQGLTPEFVLGYRAMMLDGIAREAEITKKVIAAVPDAKSDYRPDPNARTAKELAWHLANTDIQFLDGIADLNFNMETPEHKPQTSAEVVAWYDENMKRGIERVAAMSAEQLDDAGRVLRRVQLAGGALSRIPEQPQHPSPRRAGDVSASHGIEGAFDLWRQLRRAVHAAGGGRNCCLVWQMIAAKPLW